MSASQQRSRFGTGWRGLRAMPGEATAADKGVARRAQQPAAREPPTAAGTGNPLKGGGRGLVRSGDERDPNEDGWPTGAFVTVDQSRDHAKGWRARFQRPTGVTIKLSQ